MPRLRSRSASPASGDRDWFTGIRVRHSEEERPREEVRKLQVSPFELDQERLAEENAQRGVVRPAHHNRIPMGRGTT